jgi:hypothetical protein
VSRVPLLLAASLLACHPAPAGDDSGTDAESSSTGEPSPTPDFLNPAVGSFRIDANQTDPEVFVVQDIILGVTQVLLDGESLGTLQDPNTVGSLTSEALSLTVHGALAIGNHTLQLLTLTPDAPLYSVELEMRVETPDPKTRPSWSASVDPDPVASGQTLFTSGVGAGGLLALLSPGDPDPQLRIFTADAERGWTTAAPVLVALPGHVLLDMSFTPAVSTVAFPEPNNNAPKRLRIAYNIGLPATQIATRDVQLGPEPVLLDPVIAFTLGDALGSAQVEWAAFGRPVAVGDTLLAELHAAPDAEQPHPGDHRLVTSLWRGDNLGWTPPQQIGTAAPSDLDALGPAPVLVDIADDRSTTLAVRLGGAYPALLDIADDGAVALTVPPLTAPLDVSGDINLATIVSNFGSRTVAAVDTSGKVSLSVLDTNRGNGPHRASPKASSLPAAPATGALAPGVARGYPIFLIPYGDAAPVHLVASDGENSFVQPLADLHCDALALAVTLAGNDPKNPVLPLACLLDGELRLGQLTTIDAPTP